MALLMALIWRLFPAGAATPMMASCSGRCAVGYDDPINASTAARESDTERSTPTLTLVRGRSTSNESTDRPPALLFKPLAVTFGVAAAFWAAPFGCAFAISSKRVIEYFLLA